MNYVLLAVASLRSKEAPFPLNNPLTPTTLEVACFSASHCMRFIEILVNFKIYERAYHASKFSKLLRRVSKILKFVKTTKNLSISRPQTKKQNTHRY